MHLRLERLLRRRDAREVVAVPEVVELAAVRSIVAARTHEPLATATSYVTLSSGEHSGWSTACGWPYGQMNLVKPSSGPQIPKS